MAESGNNGRPGRPPQNLPARVWGDYVDAVRAVRPGPGLSDNELFEWLSREKKSAVPATLASFQRILSGNRTARPGFDVALVGALGLMSLGLDETTFDLTPDAFKARLIEAQPPKLAQILDQARDGTQISLKPRSALLGRFRHFGAAIKPVVPVSADVPHHLSIRRPALVAGVDGYLLLLGYGLADRKWQLVSAVTDTPHAPDRKTQWSALASGISMTAPYQTGEFVLHALGASGPYSPGMVALWKSLVGTPAFLDERQITQVTRETEAMIAQGAWSSALHYVME